MPKNEDLPVEAIEEFKTIYLKYFGRELSDAEACQNAKELYELYDAVYGKRIANIT